MNRFMAMCKETGVTAASYISNYDIAVDDIEKEIVPSESLFLIELASKNALR
jgi:hypothetical protein